MDTLCLDEAWYYMQAVKRRQFAEYKMQVQIHHNDPKETIAAIDEYERQHSPEPKAIEVETLDKAAFSRLVGAMSSNPRIIIKTTT